LDNLPRISLSKFINDYLGPFIQVQMWTKYLHEKNEPGSNEIDDMFYTFLTKSVSI
jgi:hypothetical protein